MQTGDKIKLTMISKSGVSRQKFIPPMDSIYAIKEIGSHIILTHDKYGDYTYYRGEIRLCKLPHTSHPDIGTVTTVKDSTIDIL